MDVATGEVTEWDPPTGLMKMMAGVMKHIGERQYRQELATLEQLLEGP